MNYVLVSQDINYLLCGNSQNVADNNKTCSAVAIFSQAGPQWLFWLPAARWWLLGLPAACCMFLDCLMVNRLLVTSAAYAVRLVRWTAHNGDSYTAAPRSSRWCTRRLCNSWCNTARATFLDGFKLVCCCVFCTLVWSCVFCNMVWRMS